MNEEIKKLISEAKNICVVPNQQEPESLTAALALFYTLKELHKNVNLIVPELPENLKFLTPSLDFISIPKNFVISIPRNIADVSQVYYEKSEENLKIHLTINSGQIKKEGISFYYADAKPDVTITLGIMDFQKELQGKLDSFGFLLDSPIINLDNHADNTKFGKINVVEEKSLAEMVLEIAKSVDEKLVTKNTATAALTGITIYYENFQSPKTTAEIFELAAGLMKQGANRQEILTNILKKKIENMYSTNPTVIAGLQ